MHIKPPWHSSSSWMPKEITQHFKSLNSGAGTLVVQTDAGLGYLKAMGNPDGPHALAKDFLGTYLACRLDLPTFDFAVIEVTELDDLPFFGSGMAEPGPAFVTRGENGSVWGNDKRLLKKIDNREVVSGLIVIDTWLRNEDRYFKPRKRANYDNVFFSRESSGKGRIALRAMDFSHAIHYGGALPKSCLSINQIRDENVFGDFPEFRKLITRDSIRHFATMLAEVSRLEIQDAVELIPTAWGFDSTLRQSLSEFLCQRKMFVAESIESNLFGPTQLTFDLGVEGEP